MVDAELAAFDATGEPRHFANAELALAWYYGKNSRGITMAHGGGCYDGLDEDAGQSAIWAPNRRSRCSRRPTRWPRAGRGCCAPFANNVRQTSQLASS